MTSRLFEKQFGILINDVKKLVSENPPVFEKVNEISSQYALKSLMPEGYVIKNFNTFIARPYGEFIKTKNAEFFLKKNDFTVDESEHNNTITFLTGIFKEMWQNGIKDETKEMIWMRLQILLKLCEKYKTETST